MKLFSKYRAGLPVLLLVQLSCFAQNEPVGKTDFSDWKQHSQPGADSSIVLSAEPIAYRYADGKGFHKGFRKIDEGVADWTKFYGLRFWVFTEKEMPVQLKVQIDAPEYEKEHIQPDIHADVTVSGAGWHEVILPWNAFSFTQAQLKAALLVVKELRIGLAAANQSGQVRIREVALTKGEVVSLSADIKGKAASKGEAVVYDLMVENVSGVQQSVHLKVDQYGWESMITSITPAIVHLAPGESKTCKVTVSVTDRLPEGRRETQVIHAIANGKALPDATITFITACALSKPNILHTAVRWQEVKDKVKKYAWAKTEQDKYVALADKWQVPEVATRLTTDNADKGMQLFNTQEEFNFMAAGISYQLTGKKEYAEKVALFLRRLSSPVNGYPTTFRACAQSFVQEGHFFQHIVMAYDMIAGAGVLGKEDLANIEKTFRLYIETVDLSVRDGAITNWVLSEETGALYCALALQDWHLAESIFSGPCGITDQLSNGVMNDGWWYECSVGYNVWCSTEFSQIALALEPWGVNFKDMRLPLATTPYYTLAPRMRQPGLYGMNFDKWGPVTKNNIGIKDMWDALPAFTDYRGMMFGVNDAQETMVAGQPYELAYYLYKDPEYAAIINRGATRDLLYGVPEIPKVVSLLTAQSAYADNMGIVLLRSNKEGLPQREQIQAALHYGTDGGFHGHFDRTNLLHLSRYGRSFYNPEMIWYGYASYLYKFYVQTSLSKNMVVVDQKMQEPVESFRTLYHTGQLMQATAVETKARWSNPPYGGMQYDYLGGISFAQKSWQEGRSVPVPANAPAYGAVTGFTEPVLQRRLMLVTDDYVVLADYNKAEKERTFDWLLQGKGFTGVEAAQKKFLQHTPQMNTDPLGSAQFITDCNWWSATGTAKAGFGMCWGKDCDNAGTLAPNNEEGPLQMNVFSAWPLEKEIMAGTAPEVHDVSRQVFYTVSGNGKLLLQDSTGAWILGAAHMDIPVKGLTTLSLEARCSPGKKPGLFWGDAKLVLENGKEISLNELPFTTKNIKPVAEKGKDYEGGPVKIAGNIITQSMAAQPEAPGETGIITVDVSSVKAVRFKATLGSDYPLGNETARRKTYAVRAKGKEAVFLTVIEPFEDKPVVKKVWATAADKLFVELLDGRVQQFTIHQLETAGGKITVDMVEKQNSQVTKQETTQDR
jgi:hypothetical protein